MIIIDDDRVIVQDVEGRKEFGIGTPDAFKILSRIWLRSGWDCKYVYSFTWLGRPVIQLPEDLIRIQEVIYRVSPTVVIETGIAHGGSLLFYAGLLANMGGGRVIGVDREIRPQNRAALAAHRLYPQLALIEGDSIDPAIVRRVRAGIRPEDRVLIVLDSMHTKAHVLAELRAYADLVSIGSYIVAADGIMQDLAGAPRSQPDWSWNNPRAAAREFLAERDDFIAEVPISPFNEGSVTEPVTYWQGGYLRRIR